MNQQQIANAARVAPAAIQDEMRLLDIALRSDVLIEHLTNEEIEEIERKAFEDIEYSLRAYIGECHTSACMARLHKRSEKSIAYYDARYEQALETYRRVTGIEPTAQQKESRQ